LGLVFFREGESCMTIYDEEVDLRPYILAIVNRWWLIALIALGLAMLALVFSLIQPRVFQSTATVLITRSRASLNLAEQFPTVNEPIDSRSRMDAILSIGQSDALALQVIEDLGEILPAADREPNEIKKKVGVSNSGDIISIEAEAKNPELAALIANTWARRAVSAINTAYSGEQPLVEIQDQLQSTRQSYEESQAELEAFIQENQISLLEQQIIEVQSALENLSQERALRIAYYTNRKQSLEDLKVQAQALQSQLSAGSESQAGNIGDAIAVLTARAHSLGVNLYDIKQVSPDNPVIIDEQLTVNPPQYDFVTRGDVVLNIQLGDLTALQDRSTLYAADLEALIELAEGQVNQAEEALQSIQEEISGTNENDRLSLLGGRLQDLETRLENERSRRRELTSLRDLAWDAYQAMAQKETELKNVSQANSPVTLASPAVPPDHPAARGTVQSVLVGGILGLVLGTVLVVGAQWWRSMNMGKPSMNQSG
jgi:uncharacterized protein involved in exopolysaccharide biosynthesis